MTLHRQDSIHEVDEQQVTLYSYDGRNLVTKKIDAVGNQELYVYDGNGNMVSKTDADGYVTEYSYGATDLVSAINYSGKKQVTYAYNKVGELVKMDDWNGITTFELDKLYQLKAVTDHKGNKVEYTYDELGNQLSIRYPNGDLVSKTYDAVGNLLTVQDPDRQTSAYTYDDANRVTKLVYPNGWVESYTYDAEGNLLKTIDTDPFHNNKTGVKYEYRYDAEGNVIYEMTRDTGVSDLVTCKDYAYDALNRMISDGKRGYTYDTLGNLVEEREPGKQVIHYQHNSLSQLTDKQVCDYISSITGIHDYKYEYDNRGNLVHEYEVCAPTTQGPKNITIGRYTYDETNRMTVGRNEKNEASVYTYNGLGIRVGQEMITEDNTHGYTDFHCDTPSIDTGIETPEVVLRSFVIDYTSPDQRVLMESEGGDVGFDYQNVYGNHKLSVKVTSDGVDWWGQAIHEDILKAYTHVDRLGSTVGLTDDYGRVLTRVHYSEWGDLLATDPITITHGFRMISPQNNYTGHEYDDVLGMYYAKARMYDQVNRRFVAVDPIKGSIVDPQSLVPYVYVADNPLRYIDPLGEASIAISILENGIKTGWGVLKTPHIPVAPLDLKPEYADEIFNKTDGKTIPAKGGNNAEITYTSKGGKKTGNTTTSKAGKIKQNTSVTPAPEPTMVYEDNKPRVQVSPPLNPKKPDPLIMVPYEGPKFQEQMPIDEPEKPYIEYIPVEQPTGPKVYADPVQEVADSGKFFCEDAKGDESTSATGNLVDLTPSKNHTKSYVNPGPWGEANSSVDIIGPNGDILTRRWYDETGRAIRDVDFTDHNNPKHHPEVPHNHTWEWSGDTPHRI